MSQAYRVYVGTYTDAGKSQGIYILEMDASTGALTREGVRDGVANPTFLAIHPSRKYLYCVNEIADFGGRKSGGVAAFAISPRDGSLALLNQESSGGAGPCHVIVDREGKNALVANYGGGSVACLPIQANGRLRPMTAFVQHHGAGADPARQEGPHAHSSTLDAANRLAFVADLGLDKVFVYRFDAARGTLTPSDPPSVSVAPGAGPRHFAFHPNGRFAYLINEIDLTITVFSYDASWGVLHPLQTISTVPAGVNRDGLSTAEVLVHPSGKFLYGSNRAHDSIVVYAIDSRTGKLTFVEHQPTQGKTPRNFVIDPSGAFLLAANQDSDTIVVFRIDAASGKLMPTGHVVEVPTPVCLRVAPVAPSV